MHATLRHTERETEAALSGALTFDDHEPFRALLNDALEAAKRTLVFNVRELRSIDSGGLGMLLIADDEAKKRGARLAIRGAGGQVRKVLELSGVDAIISVE